MQQGKATQRKSIWRLSLRILAIIIVCWLLLVGWGLAFAWHRLPAYEPRTELPADVEILSNFEYSLLSDSHARPYVYEIEADGGGALLFYGSEHTRDPANEQIADIRERWIEFQPDLAFVESRLGILFPGMMNPVETFGEVGEVALLARQHGAELLSWEPTDDTRMQALLEQPFSRRQVALYVILKPYFGNLRHGKPADPDAWLAEYVHKRGSLPGIEGEIDSVTELDRAWREEFPDGPDWRDVSDEFGLPGWMDRIDDNRARDENLLRAVLDNVMDGRRVFVIAGSSHAVKLEAALRELLMGDTSGSVGADLDGDALKSVQENF